MNKVCDFAAADNHYNDMISNLQHYMAALTVLVLLTIVIYGRMLYEMCGPNIPYSNLNARVNMLESRYLLESRRLKQQGSVGPQGTVVEPQGTVVEPQGTVVEPPR